MNIPGGAQPCTEKRAAAMAVAVAVYGGHPVNTRTHTHMTENITFTAPFACGNDVKTVSVTIFQEATVKKVSFPKIKLISFRQP